MYFKNENLVPLNCVEYWVYNGLRIFELIIEN